MNAGTPPVTGKRRPRTDGLFQWSWALTCLSAVCWSPASAAALGHGEGWSLGIGKIVTFFFLTLGPFAVIRPFARRTAELDPRSRRQVALMAAAISLASLLVSATLGVFILRQWGISVGALLIAAGIMLFIVALHSIGAQYAAEEQGPVRGPGGGPDAPLLSTAFHLAFPYIVSPYGVAVVVLVLTTLPEEVSVTVAIGVLVGIMLLNLVVMLLAHGASRSSVLPLALGVVSSVLAVLQAALGVQAVLAGLRLAGLT